LAETQLQGADSNARAKKKPAGPAGFFAAKAAQGIMCRYVRMSRSFVSLRKIEPMTSDITATTIGYHRP